MNCNNWMFDCCLACQRCTEPRLKEFLKYARVELAPPTAADLPAIQKGFSNLMTAAKTQKWQAVTVKVCIPKPK